MLLRHLRLCDHADNQTGTGCIKSVVNFVTTSNESMRSVDAVCTSLSSRQTYSAAQKPDCLRLMVLNLSHTLFVRAHRIVWLYQTLRWLLCRQAHRFSTDPRTHMPYLKMPKPPPLASVVIAAVAQSLCSPAFAIELGVAALSELQPPRFAVPIDLGVLPGGVRSEATGINSANQVAGESDTFAGFSRAVRWQPRSVRNLGTLPKTTDSFASAINSSGTVVGYSGDSLGKKACIHVQQRGPY